MKRKEDWKENRNNSWPCTRRSVQRTLWNWPIKSNAPRGIHKKQMGATYHRSFRLISPLTPCPPPIYVPQYYNIISSLSNLVCRKTHQQSGCCTPAKTEFDVVQQRARQIPMQSSCLISGDLRCRQIHKADPKVPGGLAKVGLHTVAVLAGNSLSE